MEITKDKNTVLNNVVAIPIDRITPNPNQPRHLSSMYDLESLKGSIYENGLIQPVTLREIENGFYEIIAGERRCRACLELGFKYIPAIVENISEEKSAVIALVENLQRKNLNFFEEAMGINKLMEDYDFTQQQAGDMLGKSQGAIANKIRLLKINENVRNLILENLLTERHARALLQLINPLQQLKATKFIISHKLNVEQSEKYIAKIIAKNKGEDKGNTIIFVSDVRIFFNTVEKAVNFMKSAGISVDSEQYEDDQFINYKVRIPKSQSYNNPKQLNA